MNLAPRYIASLHAVDEQLRNSIVAVEDVVAELQRKGDDATALIELLGRLKGAKVVAERIIR